MWKTYVLPTNTQKARVLLQNNRRCAYFLKCLAAFAYPYKRLEGLHKPLQMVIRRADLLKCLGSFTYFTDREQSRLHHRITYWQYQPLPFPHVQGLDCLPVQMVRSRTHFFRCVVGLRNPTNVLEGFFTLYIYDKTTC